MPHRASRKLAFVLSFGLLTTGSALAQVPFPTTPTLPPGGLSALNAGQWHLTFNQVSGNTLIGNVESTKELHHLLPKASEITAQVLDSQAIGSKSAVASAHVTATSMGTAASAGDPLNPDSTFTGALSSATLTYVTVLDIQTTVRLDLKLDGRLGVNGARALGDDKSSAFLAVNAIGSLAEGTDADYRALYDAAGIDAFTDGAAMLAQIKNWPTTTQAHLATVGAQADTSHTLVTVDETLQVVAEGTRIDCDPSLAAICGKYVYFASLFMVTGAQNGAFADFSHTLGVTGVSIGGGATQPFVPASPVPEPASALLMVAGLAALARLRRRAV